MVQHMISPRLRRKSSAGTHDGDRHIDLFVRIFRAKVVPQEELVGVRTETGEIHRLGGARGQRAEAKLPAGRMTATETHVDPIAPKDNIEPVN
jgi:hypothetical protein